MVSFFKKKESPILTRKVVTPTRRLSPFYKQIFIGIALVCVLSLLITAVWYGTRIASFQIEEIEVVGGVTIPHTVMIEKTETVLTGTYLRLIPKRFIPFYPQDKIVETLMQVPRVKQVHVESIGEQKIAIAFDEYVPEALWCESTDTKSCLFMDVHGFAFAPTPELEGSAFVRYVDNAHKPEIKTYGFDEAFIKDTMQFIELLESSLSLYVTHVEKVEDYDIEYTLSEGGVIKVARRMSPEETFSNLKTILNSKEFVHIAPGAFEYIDLRFGDKVFVSEVPLRTGTSSASTTSINE